jgi:hypothetical protein
MSSVEFCKKSVEHLCCVIGDFSHTGLLTKSSLFLKLNISFIVRVTECVVEKYSATQ